MFTWYLNVNYDMLIYFRTVLFFFFSWKKGVGICIPESTT